MPMVLMHKIKEFLNESEHDPEGKSLTVKETFKKMVQLVADEYENGDIKKVDTYLLKKDFSDALRKANYDYSDWLSEEQVKTVVDYMNSLMKKAAVNESSDNDDDNDDFYDFAKTKRLLDSIKSEVPEDYEILKVIYGNNFMKFKDDYGKEWNLTVSDTGYAEAHDKDINTLNFEGLVDGSSFWKQFQRKR